MAAEDGAAQAARGLSPTPFDRIREERVVDEFRREFDAGDQGYAKDNTGPPPNMDRRRLVFDSLRTIIDQGAGSGNIQSDRGRYLYIFGAGYHGQLGRKAARGAKKYANLPIPVELTEPVRQIACGALHTAVLTDDGKVLTWGDGRMGQLGNLQEGFANCAQPMDVDQIAGHQIKLIACGQNHTVAVAKSGEIFAWGWCKYGQLGLGSRTNQRYPVEIKHKGECPLFDDIVQVSCGDRHTACVTRKGHVFTFGSGEHGQLGHGDNHDQFSPKQVMALKDYKIKQVACGAIHTVALTEDGQVFVFGFGEALYGKGMKNFHYDPVKIDFKYRVSQVASGQSHIMLVTEDHNDVYAWGGGTYGEIGQGAFKSSQVPRLVLCGKNIASISCGRYHSAAVSYNGVLYTWGCGDNGQLGRMENKQDNYTKRAHSLPKVCVSLLGNVVGEVSCGEHHTCVVASCRYTQLADDVAAWGKLEEMEFQIKMNILGDTKQKGRGIAKRDLARIRKWRKDEEARRSKKATQDKEAEARRIQSEVSKIAGSAALRDQAEDLVRTQQDAMLPPIKQKSSRKKAAGLARSATTSSLEDMPRRGRPAAIQKVTAKTANAARTSFHEYGQQFLQQMGQQIYEVRSGGGKILKRDDYLKRKFTLRKTYDKLKLGVEQKEQDLQRLHEELTMLQEADDCSEEASQTAEQQLRQLGMKLNTVMIKISEAERSRVTYELNITHIKDESQENHKQLDALRRSLFYQEGLYKKIQKFKEYASTQRDMAQSAVTDFQSEITDWNNFLEFQYRNLTAITKGKNEAESQEALKAVQKKQERRRQKTLHRINKLSKLVEANDDEVGRLRNTRENLEEKIDYYEERFQQIQQATGLSDPDEIVNKYFVNQEIEKDQTAKYEKKKAELEMLQKEQQELSEELTKLSTTGADHTWREVDQLQEELHTATARLQQKKADADRLSTTITQLNEWMHTILHRIDEHLGKYELTSEQRKQPPADASPADLMQATQDKLQVLKALTEDLENGTGKFTRIEVSSDEEAEEGRKRRRKNKKGGSRSGR